MKKKTAHRQPAPAGKPRAGKKRSAYGDTTPICINTGCALRKKAKCYGFEGCPGFQSR